jgi:hypothetical protein
LKFVGGLVAESVTAPKKMAFFVAEIKKEG